MSVSLTTCIMPKRPKVLHAGKEFLTNFVARQAPVEAGSLSNGVRLASQAVPGARAASVSLTTRSGSRFETKSTNGAAHLLQKAIFQGTSTRSAADIQKGLAAIGGQLETNTGRETQTLSLFVQKDDVPAAVELLGDVVRNAKLDEESISGARGAAVEALKDWENDLWGQVHNNMHRACYDTTEETAGGALGNAPLGNGANLKGGLTEVDLQAFRDQYLDNASGTAIAVAGGVDQSAFQGAVEKAFGSQVAKPIELVKRYVGGHCKIGLPKPLPPYNQHIAVGFETAGYSCPDHVPLQLLQEVYGNYDRFRHDLVTNWAVRYTYERTAEQYGKQPLQEVHTFSDKYSDTGLMGFYFVSGIGAGYEEPYHYLSRLQGQWTKFCHRLEEYEVDMGKNHLKSKYLFDRDGASKSAKDFSEQLVHLGRVVPTEEYFQRVDDLTIDQISDTINHYWYDREPVLSCWGIYKCLPEYYYVRRWNSRWRY